MGSDCEVFPGISGGPGDGAQIVRVFPGFPGPGVGPQIVTFFPGFLLYRTCLPRLQLGMRSGALRVAWGAFSKPSHPPEATPQASVHDNDQHRTLSSVPERMSVWTVYFHGSLTCFGRHFGCVLDQTAI